MRHFSDQHRIMSRLNHQSVSFIPARSISSPHLTTNPDAEREYLTELLAEMQKLGPFMQVFPLCSRLLDQEISRISERLSTIVLVDFDRLQCDGPSPMASVDMMPNIGGNGNWNGSYSNNIQPERFGGVQSMMTMDLQAAQGSPDSFLVKRLLRVDIPVDRYPDYNFVGRLLGPRGNSLKRVEASTGCRIYIRGRSSMKDPNMEEKLRGKLGFEHLNEPLHILVEVESPADIADGRLKLAKDILEELLIPVDDSQDAYKRDQLRELAMLNNSRAQSPQPSGSTPTFTSSGMKRSNVCLG